MSPGPRVVCSIVLFVFTSLGALTASAQHRVDLRIRSHAVGFRDVVASQLPYDGLTVSGDLGHQWQGQRLSSGVELGLGHGRLSSATSDALVLTRTMARLNGDLLFHVATIGSWRLEIGPNLENTLGTHAFESGGFVQYTGHFTLGATARASRRVRSHEFAFDLASPLAGYLVRPPYAMESNDLWRDGSVGGILGSGTFSSVHNLQRFSLSGSWRWYAWRRMSLGLGGGWRMQRIIVPRVYLESDFTLSLLVSLHPGKSK